MELKELKKIQEDLKKNVIITPFEIKSGNVLGLDSAYLLEDNEIISSAIVFNLEKKEVIERVYSKKKFPFHIYLGFCHLEK